MREPDSRQPPPPEARATTAMSSAEHRAPSFPGIPWPPDIDSSFSEEEQRAIAMLYEQKMAEPPAGTPFLTFKLNNLRWGVAVAHLREALPSVSSITPLPFSPLWLYGLINLRGEPVGLVNLSDLLFDPITASNVRHRTAVGAPVIIAENEGVLLGLLVEELGEVAFLEGHHFEKLPAAAMRSLPSFAVAHLLAAWTPSETDQPVLLLDLARLITSLLKQLTSEEARNG
jgi:chemotaxis signal transduction protein